MTAEEPKIHAGVKVVQFIQRDIKGNLWWSAWDMASGDGWLQRMPAGSEELRPPKWDIGVWEYRGSYKP